MGTRHATAPTANRGGQSKGAGQRGTTSDHTTIKPTGSTFLDHALAYRARGWFVFPLKTGTKQPITKHGFKDASNDPEVIRAWWGKTPRANIGLDCGRSGVIVIDVDGDEGLNTLADLEAARGLVYSTLTSHTPGKAGKGAGLHLLFKMPEGLTIGNKKIGPGLETRGAGGYIVLSPSIHPDHPKGPAYRWADNATPIADLPQVFIDLLTAEPESTPRSSAAATTIPLPAPARPVSQREIEHYSQAALDDELVKLRAAREGDRNNQLNRSAFALGQLVGAGTLDRSSVEVALEQAARDIGLKGKEVALTIKSGVEDGSASPRDLSHLADRRNGNGPDQDATDKAAATPTKPKPERRPPTKSGAYITALAEAGYSFRFNELVQDIEVNGAPLTDNLAAEIRCKMRDFTFSDMRALEDAYTAHALKNAYHPIKEYLNGLKWDGRAHIEQLGTFLVDSHAPFANGDRVARRLLRRWLIGAVGKVLDQIQTPMLVLEGRQNLGKSHFIAWIASPMPAYFVEGPIAPDDKDCKVRLMSRWIWEVSELGATTRRADVEALKSFVTLRDVTVRRPYGRRDVHGPAVCSLIGTLNDTGAGFLNDTTGSRRFLTLALTELHWDYRKFVDIGQVWAEAVAAYRAGESPYLTPEERDKQAEINACFTAVDPVEDLITTRYVIDPNRQDWITPSADILRAMDDTLRGTSTGHARSIAAYLKTRGIVSSRPYVGGHPVRGYRGIRPLSDTETNKLQTAIRTAQSEFQPADVTDDMTP